MADDDDELPDIADTIVKHTLAKSEMDDTAVYLQAGRAHQGLAVAALEELFVNAFRAWALAASSGQRYDHTRLDGIRAEFRLRGIEPAYDRVKLEMALLTESAKRAYDRMTPEQVDEAGGDLIRDYLKDLDAQQ